MEAEIAALGRSQAMIEFGVDGIIHAANANFLNTMGYEAAEVVGHHHAMFMPEEDRKTPAYREFWEALARGEFRSASFRRICKIACNNDPLRGVFRVQFRPL